MRSTATEEAGDDYLDNEALISSKKTHLVLLKNLLPFVINEDKKLGYPSTIEEGP